MLKKIWTFFHYPTPYLEDWSKQIESLSDNKKFDSGIFLWISGIFFLLIVGGLLSFFIFMTNTDIDKNNYDNLVYIYDFLNFFISVFIFLSIIELFIRKRKKIFEKTEKQINLNFVIYKIFLFCVLGFLLFNYGFIIAIVLFFIPKNDIKDRIMKIIFNPKDYEV